MSLPVAEITGNSLILLGVMIVLVFAVAYALLNKHGSGISKTPDDSQQAPGSEGPSEEAGIDLGQGSATGSDRHGESDPQHGAN